MAMPLEAHGATGGSIFLFLYAFAIWTPVSDLLENGDSSRRPAVILVVVATVIFAFSAISNISGGGIGEPLGCITGLFVWAGRYTGSAIALMADLEESLDFFQVIGASIPAVIVGAGLWLIRLLDRS